MPHVLAFRKINHTPLFSRSQYGWQIKKLLPPWAGLMDFRGKVQTSPAGRVGLVSSEGRNGPTQGPGRLRLHGCTLHRISFCFPSRGGGEEDCGLGDGGLSWGRISTLISSATGCL